MISKIDELRLIARCVTLDDHRAFARLVDEYSPGLRRFVYNLTLGDASLTDDISQETFIKAYISLRSFRGLSRFSTWLYTIACREYADYRRRNARTVSLDPATTAADLDTGYSTPHRASDIHHDLEVAMSCLSEHERMAVLLFYLEDRPIKDISRITGMPEGTIKSHLSRAKSKMAQTINEYES